MQGPQEQIISSAATGSAASIFQVASNPALQKALVLEDSLRKREQFAVSLRTKKRKGIIEGKRRRMMENISNKNS